MLGFSILPNGEHVVVSVFSRGTEMGLSDGEIRAAIIAAENRIADIGKIVYEHYQVGSQQEQK